MELDEACALASLFGGGMGMGSVCGALIRAFREAHDDAVSCAELLRMDRAKGNMDKRAHCGQLICDSVQILEELLSQM